LFCTGVDISFHFFSEFEHWQMMFLISAATRYESTHSDFLAVAVSLFLGVQSDAEVQAEDLGFIKVRIGDSLEMEDGEFRKSPPPKVSGDLDNPYAMVLDTQRQPSFSIVLPAQQPQVAPLS
jgi:hypothetical protein